MTTDEIAERLVEEEREMFLPIGETGSLKRRIAEALRAEREACAKVAEETPIVGMNAWEDDAHGTVEAIAAAIRSRP